MIKITCSNCEHRIKTDYINLRSFVCPSCFKKQKVSNTSTIIFALIFIIPLVFILMFNQDFIIKTVFFILWIWLSLWVIQPKIYRYEVISEKEMKV